MFASETKPATPDRVVSARMAFTSFIGIAVVFFDYYLCYIIIKAMYFSNKLKNEYPQVGDLDIHQFPFAIGLCMGALLLTYWGDRAGRKWALTFPLLVMGLYTVLVGMLAIGETAPRLTPLLGPYTLHGGVMSGPRGIVVKSVLLWLLCFGLGMGMGGECGVAARLAGVCALRSKGGWGWYGIFPQLGLPVGWLLIVWQPVMFSLFPPPLPSWGWSLALVFMTGVALTALGLYARLKIAELPVVKVMWACDQRARAPMTRQYWRPVLLGALALVTYYRLLPAGPFGWSWYYSPDVPVCLGLSMLLSAWASNRWGRKPVLIVGLIAAIAVDATAFAVTGSSFGRAPTMELRLMLELKAFLLGTIFAPMGALLLESFPAPMRATGVGMAYGIGAILGLLLPVLFAIVSISFHINSAGLSLALTHIISLLAVLCLRETRERRKRISG